MGCKHLIPLFLVALSYICDIGLDGCFVSLPISVTASQDEYGVLWRNYQSHSMGHMSARWKISGIKIGNTRTGSSIVLQQLLVHSRLRSLQSSSLLISKDYQPPNTWTIGGPKTRDMLYYPPAPVYSLSSTWMIHLLSNSHIFR